MARFIASFAVLILALAPQVSAPAMPPGPAASVLEDQLLVTWYGNPRSPRMGVLGDVSGAARAEGLRRQAEQFIPLTAKTVVMAYHLVSVVAQCSPGSDGAWRRRETSHVIVSMLEEARANGFRLVLDVQPGRSPVVEEVEALVPYLREPDVYLALDPEFDMTDCQVPGQHVGQLPAADVNAVLDLLERVISAHHLPPKVLVLHQYRLDMLPDKARIRRSPLVDIVLDMDGFGSQALKLSTYRAVMRQGQLAYAGIKIFYRQDVDPLSPSQVMALRPTPSIIVYQ